LLQKKTLLQNHLLNENCSIKDAFQRLETLSPTLLLLIINDSNKLVGLLTDGDIRRFLTKEGSMERPVKLAMNPHFQSLNEDNYKIQDLIQIKDNQLEFIPIVNEFGIPIDLLNLKEQRSLLPIQCVIMAGGKGERLMPLTENTPKPLLKIGNKPIIQYNLDLIKLYGIQQIFITTNYLSEKIDTYITETNQSHIKTVKEPEILGTIGSLSLIKKGITKDVLLMNSDLLTNIDLEAFYLHFINENADIAVACIPYNVEIPYGVMETENFLIKSVKEKPTYTYYSNAGIYLIKKTLIENIPNSEKIDATTFIEQCIANGKKIVSFPLLSYWLDIGKHEDFNKAQSEVNMINF